MTREEAKILTSIPKKKLKVIAPRIYKNFDVVKAYANGAEVEFLDNGKWYLESNPSFSLLFEYRVKKVEDQPYGSWTPEFGQTYYIIDNTGQVSSVRNSFSQADYDRFEFGNFYRTFVSAAGAANAIREAFFNSKTMS